MGQMPSRAPVGVAESWERLHNILKQKNQWEKYHQRIFHKVSIIFVLILCPKTLKRNWVKMKFLDWKNKQDMKFFVSKTSQLRSKVPEETDVCVSGAVFWARFQRTCIKWRREGSFMSTKSRTICSVRDGLEFYVKTWKCKNLQMV